jgi:hypothetical protein
VKLAGTGVQALDEVGGSMKRIGDEGAIVPCGTAVCCSCDRFLHPGCKYLSTT